VDEEQYYNPIISTYLKVKALQQEQSQHQSQLEQRKAEEQNKQKNEEQLIKQAQQRIDQEHELHKMQNELAKGHLDLASHEASLHTSEFVRNAIASGVSPESAATMAGGSFDQGTTANIPTQTPGEPPINVQGAGPGSPQIPQTVRIPGIPNAIPIGGMPTPEIEAQNLARRAKLVSGAQAEGQLPSEMALLKAKGQQEKELKQQEEQFTSNITDRKIASEERLAKLSKDTQMFITGATNATHLQVANMEYNIPQDQLKAGVVAALSGQRKFNSDDRFSRAVNSSVQMMGGREVDPKDIDALKQGQTLGPLFDQLREFADKHLPSEAHLGSLGAKGASLIQGTLAGTPFPSDVKNKMAEIKASAMNVGKVIEGLTGGRVTNTQLGLALDAITSPGITKEQALDRLDNIKDLYTNKMENVIMGGMPPAQKELIYKVNGIKPAWLITAPKKNVKGHDLNEAKSMEVGQPVYK
jgi:hypothetical protein